MTQRSRLWDGSTVGDATEAPYDAATEFSKIFMSIAGAGGVSTNLSAVFRNELNQLAATGAATPVAIASGRALTWGSWYENDASVNVAIPTPAVSTRIDRIVLRKDWLNQTVRLTRIAGVEGGAEPALTQVEGTTWDEPLWRVTITTGGVITLVDQREFVGGRLPNSWTAGSLIYADTTTSLSSVPAGALNSILTSTGTSTAPAWQATAILTSVTLNTTGLILNSGAFINFASQTTAFIRGGSSSTTFQSSGGLSNLSIADGGGITLRGTVTTTLGNPFYVVNNAGTTATYMQLLSNVGANITYVGMDSAAGTTLFNGAAYAAGISAPTTIYLRISGSAINVVTVTAASTTFASTVIVTTGAVNLGGAAQNYIRGTAAGGSIVMWPNTGGFYVNNNAGTVNNLYISDAGAAAFTGTTFFIGATGSTNPAFSVNAAAASSVTGIQIVSHALAGAADILVTSSGTNEGLTINAKGNGIIALAGVSTGIVTVGTSLTVTTNVTATSGNITASAGNIVATLGAFVVTTGTVGVIPLNLSIEGLNVHHIRLASYTGLQATGSGAQMWLFSNAFYNGTVFKYITTFTAASISMTSGTIAFQVAVSGTAGTNITWVSALTVQNNGRLTLGVLPAFVASDKYVVVSAAGEIHVSALGPAS